MINRIYFILLATLLLAACSGTDTQSHEAPSPSDLTSTSASRLISTETPLPLPVNTADRPEDMTNQPNADVVHVRAELNNDNTWTFHVTVAHPDTGWDDYADGWDVVTPDGLVIKVNPDDPFTRLLLHPHENEQPFTRSQSGIIIPEGVSQVRVRAHDLVDGFGGQEILVDLEKESGPGFEVDR
jgi:hypothetical protein